MVMIKRSTIVKLSMHPWKEDNIFNEQVENRTTTKVFSGN